MRSCYFLKILLALLFVVLEKCKAVYQSQMFTEAISNVTPDKKCLHRGSILPLPVFQLRSGHECYTFSTPMRFKEGVGPYNFSYEEYIFNETRFRVPVTLLSDSTKLFYNASDKIAVRLIGRSFKTETFLKKWKDCADEAMECCEKKMTNENIFPNEKFPCPTIWDAWNCFPSSAAGSVVERVCPAHIVSGNTDYCDLYSRKTCFANGTWNPKTDYTGCSIAPTLLKRNNFHIYSLYAAIGISAPAILILFMFKELKVLRVELHRNLLIAIVVKYIVVVLSKSIVIVDAITSTGKTVMSENSVFCRILATVEKISINSVYAFMLADGFILYAMIVTVFNGNPSRWIVYGVVAAFSIVPNIWWVSMMASQQDNNCWMVDTSGWYQYINDGFRYLMLGINSYFLGRILFILYFKVSRAKDSHQSGSTLKAVCILLPLFGVQFILTSVRPKHVSCTLEDTYFYITYLLDATQGPFVSLFYCYCNKEVRCLCFKSWRNLRERLGFGNDELGTAPRNTTATMVRQSEFYPPRSTLLNTIHSQQKKESSDEFQGFFSKSTPGRVVLGPPITDPSAEETST